MRTAILALLACLVTGSVTAQPQTRAATSPTDFDFLEGRWDVIYNNSAPNIPRNVRGTWIAMKQADGRVLYDEFKLFGPDGAPIVLGLTYRIYDHTNERWDMRYVAVIGPGPDGRAPQLTATWAELTARREGASIRVDQRGKASQLRITYFDIGKDRFSWKADVSIDGGNTWTKDQIRIEARRADLRGSGETLGRWPSPASAFSMPEPVAPRVQRSSEDCLR